MEDTRFLYYVNPRKAIKNLNEDLKLVRVPHSYYLTKEEVLKCLECGVVYRRFSNEDKYEKVSKYNLDRLHNEKFIEEKDWDSTVVVKEEPIVEVVEEVKVAEEVKPEPEVVVVKEEVVEELPVETTSLLDAVEEENNEDEVTSETFSSDTEAEVEEVEVEENPSMPTPKVNYNNNKKKHH